MFIVWFKEEIFIGDIVTQAKSVDPKVEHRKNDSKSVLVR